MVRDITLQVQIAKVKSEFVANASHEMRTPLATIRAAVDSLGSLGPLGPDSQEEFTKIRDMLDRHTTRLEEMTHDLLSLHTIETAKQPLRLEDVEAGSLVRWAQEQFSPRAADKGVALEVSAEPPSAVFTSDQMLLRLILQNLLDNAIKFTPPGGHVTCRLDVGEELLRLSVSDTGCGIPPALHERVFERFFQVEPARSGSGKARGTGLGLAIVKHATERLGGAVSLKSQPGQGTGVEVRLPLVGQEAAPPR